TSTGDNCSGVLLKIGDQFQCAISNPGQAYQSTGYTYTDPYGRVYTIGPDGALQSLKDLNNNTLTVTPKRYHQFERADRAVCAGWAGKDHADHGHVGESISVHLRRERQPKHGDSTIDRTACGVWLRSDAFADERERPAWQYRLDQLLSGRQAAIDHG